MNIDETAEREKSKAIRNRQRAIGRELRRMYDHVAQEAVPDDFLNLLQQIDQVGKNAKGPAS